jgi:radical SAM superfamily enzyme YgiQ (UPF0313 family)
MHPDNIQPPLGLGYLAASMQKSGYDVKIMDLELSGMNPEKLVKYIKNNGLIPDVVGVQCYTYGMSIVKRYLEVLKSLDRKIITIVGGPQPTTQPEFTYEYLSPYIDFVIGGEAEYELPHLLNKIRENRGIDTKIIFSKFIENLDALPFPLWEQMNPSLYPPAPHGAFYKSSPVAPMIASRGCPYDCSFCSATRISGRKLRYRSVENIIDEMKYLMKYFNVREIHFVDDNLTFDRNFIVRLCEVILAKGINLNFSCPNGVRVDTLDREILSLMKRTGFYSISLGIESGSPRMLSLLNKKIDLEYTKNVIRWMNEMGIKSVGFFIVGLPGETEEDIDMTIEYAINSGLIRANFMLYHPLPGTKLYNNFVPDNINFDAVSFSSPAFTYNGANKFWLKKMQVKSFLKFYMRPDILSYTLKDIKSFKHFRYILKRVLRWMFSSWIG